MPDLRAAPDRTVDTDHWIESVTRTPWKPRHDGKLSANASDIPDRDFRADCPNQNWLTDFGQIWVAKKWLYVAVVRTCFRTARSAGA